ncbi:MAG TPA: FeoA family protein [Candidatus Bathyarchaeia archaeon]|nr:FeoA family protein [Candidatus Bathyarchaeia archaeon]
MSRLTEMKTGQQCIFIRLHDAGTRRVQRLADMGLLPGEPLRVLHNSGHGPVTILAKGARIALGYMIAGSIEVKEITNG